MFWKLRETGTRLQPLGKLLHRVVEEPVIHNYVEELPASVIAALIQAVTELHFWNMDFRRSPQA